MDGGPDWPEEKGKNVARFVWSDDDGGAKVLHLKATRKERENKGGGGWVSAFVHVTSAAPR